MEPEIYVALELSSSETDPEKMTETLGLQPSRSWRRGDDPRPPGTRKHREHGWILKTSTRPSWDFSDALEELLGWIEPSGDDLREIIRRRSVSARLSFVGHLGEAAPGLYLENEILERISSLGVDLTVDLVVMGPELPRQP